MTELLFTHGSYLVLTIVLILTGAGLPVPEEVPIIAAGLLSAHGRLNPWLAAGCCLFGALAGDCVMYWLGYRFGRRVICEHPWWVRCVSPEREAQIERMLQQHGLKVFFLARFLVGLRSPVYLSAGVLRVPFRRFLLIDLFCATMVIGTFFGLSYRYGEAITRWIRGAEYVLTGVVLLCLSAAAIYLWRRHGRAEWEKAHGESPDLPPSDVPEGSDHVEAHSTSPWCDQTPCDDQYAATPKRGD